MVQSRKYVVGRGSKLVFTTSGFEAGWVSYTVTGRSREAHDVTDTNSPGGAMKYVPGDFVDPGSIDVEIRFDAANPPPFDDPETIQLRLRASGSTDELVYQGEGFLTSENWTVPAPGAGTIEGSFTLKKTGPWSAAPAATVDA